MDQIELRYAGVRAEMAFQSAAAARARARETALLARRNRAVAEGLLRQLEGIRPARPPLSGDPTRRGRPRTS